MTKKISIYAVSGLLAMTLVAMASCKEAEDYYLSADSQSGTSTGGVAVTETKTKDVYEDGTLKYKIYYPRMTADLQGFFSNEKKEVTVPTIINVNGRLYTVTKVGVSAFSKSSFEKMTLPATIDSIDYHAFYQAEGTITFMGTTPPKLLKGSYSYTPFDDFKGIILVLPSALENYLTADGWKDYAMHIADTNWNPNQTTTASGEPLHKVTGAGTSKSYDYQSSELCYKRIDDNSAMVVDEVYSSNGHTADYVVPAAIRLYTRDMTVTGIGEKAFNYSYTTKITLPSTIRTLGSSAFESSKLVSIEIPNGVTVLPKSAFSSCSSLTSVTLPGTLTEIGESAFYKCTSLLSQELPNGIITIGKSAFEGCKALRAINLPGSVAELGASAFSSCEELAQVFLPEGLKTIGQSAFSSCKNLQNINIPTTLTDLASEAFSGCSNLRAITIPRSVTVLSPNIFKNCSELASVTLSEGLTEIGSSAFYNCSNLQSISIPSTVTRMDSQVFYYCKSLTSITCKATTPPSIASNTFTFGSYLNIPETAKIYVPATALEAYKTAPNWQRFADKIVAIE